VAAVPSELRGPEPRAGEGRDAGHGLLERDDLGCRCCRSPTPRERLVALLRGLGLVDGGGRLAAALAGSATPVEEAAA
jgi:hypothetical protein